MKSTAAFSSVSFLGGCAIASEAKGGHSSIAPERTAGELKDLGFSRDGIEEIESTFRLQIEEGQHPGAQLAIYRDGVPVVFFSGGVARRSDATMVGDDTMFVLFSATKAWAAVCAHLLVERGQLNLDARVADYWPEFGKHGKDRVTVRQALAHRGGYPMRDMPNGDGDIVRRQIENTRLSWQPGKANGYHAVFFGHTIEVLIERIDGRKIPQFLQEEFFEPLGMTDSYLGLPADREDLEARVAHVYEMERGTPGHRFQFGLDTENPPVEEWKFVWNRPEVHQMVLPSGGGIGTARDLARFYAMLANGGEIDGSHILKRETIERAIARTNQPGEFDRRYFGKIAWGLGFMIGDGPEGAAIGAGALATRRCFGHPGAGCVFAWGDLESRLAVAFCTNGNRKFRSGMKRAAAISDSIWRAMGSP